MTPANVLVEVRPRRPVRPVPLAAHAICHSGCMGSMIRSCARECLPTLAVGGGHTLREHVSSGWASSSGLATCCSNKLADNQRFNDFLFARQQVGTGHRHTCVVKRTEASGAEVWVAICGEPRRPRLTTAYRSVDTAIPAQQEVTVKAPLASATDWPARDRVHSVRLAPLRRSSRTGSRRGMPNSQLVLCDLLGRRAFPEVRALPNTITPMTSEPLLTSRKEALRLEACTNSREEPCTKAKRGMSATGSPST
jgi:hypothetical protein